MLERKNLGTLTIPKDQTGLIEDYLPDKIYKEIKYITDVELAHTACIVYRYILWDHNQESVSKEIAEACWNYKFIADQLLNTRLRLTGSLNAPGIHYLSEGGFLLRFIIAPDGWEFGPAGFATRQQLAVCISMEPKDDWWLTDPPGAGATMEDWADYRWEQIKMTEAMLDTNLPVGRMAYYLRADELFLEDDGDE